MIRILKVAFGNFSEAFIEKSFSEGVNIILSNDNNRGKTLVFQSLMYALGNEAIFPCQFDDSEYYYYCQFTVSNESCEVVRKNKTFLVIFKEKLEFFNSVSDFKDIFFTKNIFDLPVYEKDSLKIKTDLFVFFQLFFLAQDKRDTSNIQNHSYRTKKDFELMIESMMYPSNKLNEVEKEIRLLKIEEKNLTAIIAKEEKKSTFLSKNKAIAKMVFSSTYESEVIELKKKLKSVHAKVSKLKTDIRHEETRISKQENLLSDLNSINRIIEMGKIVCLSCGSEDISYKVADDFCFDLTNEYVRNQIRSSIKSQIDERRNLLVDLNEQLKNRQKEYANIIDSKDQEMYDVILYRHEIKKADTILNKLKTNRQNLLEIKNKIKLQKETVERVKDNVKGKNEKLLKMIKNSYTDIDPLQDNPIESLFTKQNENFSGSDAQLYYYAKLVSFHNFFNLPFPIIIDSFRDGEISTEKERRILQKLSKMNTQVLLSATLKEKEYSSPYSDLEGIHVIDYSEKTENHILNKSDLNDFLIILKKFNIHKGTNNNG
ncbi:MAG: hypothetical protein ACRC5H_08160 [Treponemataceae bacterium]